jgi:hypothetical protein
MRAVLSKPSNQELPGYQPYAAVTWDWMLSQFEGFLRTESEEVDKKLA